MESTVLKLSPEKAEKLTAALALYGVAYVANLPIPQKELEISVFLHDTQLLIEEHGEAWIKENRAKLINELETIFREAH